MGELPSLQPGDVFAEKYRLVRLIKAGGMGAVYEVRHTANDKRWALKLMHPELARDPGARERFQREAKIDGLIDSAFVVSVIDAGIEATTQSPYLVMEFLVGEDLRERLARAGRCTATDVVVYLGHVARALDKAHAKKIVHRDLKPENLFLCQSDDEGEKVKVLDFGIAKILATAVLRSTHGGGTPLYMAPEQTRRGREIGPWTDIWALGLIAYVLLVGKEYWLAETVGEFYGEILSTDPREPPSRRAARAGVSLPEAFDAWFFRCVDNDPQNRFARAGEAVAMLAVVLAVGPPSRASSEKAASVPAAAAQLPTVMVTPMRSALWGPAAAPVVEAMAQTRTEVGTPQFAGHEYATTPERLAAQNVHWEREQNERFAAEQKASRERERTGRRAMLVLGLSTIGVMVPGFLVWWLKASKEPPKELYCVDTSGLSAADFQVRTALGYEDKSTESGKTCKDCQQFVAAIAATTTCATCKIVKGPINPRGYCRSFVARIAVTG